MAEPWYRRVMRWGQTNIREIDALPEHYDVDWWVEYWKRTRVQGVIINAGGIVAYYPSALSLHRRSPYLGHRDLFGELCTAARDHGLVVVARMDSSRAGERFYYEHPDWFAVDASGQPYRAGDFDGPFYTACISGPYYREYLPQVLREICGRYRPEGFADNSWSGLSRTAPGGGICYCPHCRAQFAAASGGLTLPRAQDWEDRVYRAWIEWSYAQRIAIWELNNATVKRYGGPDCEWSGMNSGSLTNQCRSFRDWRAMADRVRVIFLDHQGRSGSAPIWQNGEQGKLIRSLMGDDAPMPESIALYNNANASFRLASKPEPEVRLWFCDAVAGGIRPWWHHIGAHHEDRRMFHTAASLFRWHEANERYLRDRRHLASIAIVYSQRNVDFYGRDDAEHRCDAPARGLAAALVRARIPYAMVNAGRLFRPVRAVPAAGGGRSSSPAGATGGGRSSSPAGAMGAGAGPLSAGDLTRYRALLLPNLGALSDEQCRSLEAYVAAGGGLLATGETSLYDDWGERRSDFGLATLFGARATGATLVAKGREPSYLRFVDPPGQRPPPLDLGPTPAFTAGWAETNHLPFGGDLLVTQPAGIGERVALTYIPPFPPYPPEFAYMKVERTDLPCLYLQQLPDGQGGPGHTAGRVAYLPADVDRTYWRLNQPDHAELLAALTRWVAGDDLPVRVAGPGLVDVHAYTQDQDGRRVIVHLVNLTHAGTWKSPVDELIAIGEQHVTVHLPPGQRATTAHLLVAEQTPPLEPGDGQVTVIVPGFTDHEVVVIELESAPV